MKKNITFAADEELIKKAREKAKQEQFSLNHLFQEWLRQYVNQNQVEGNCLQLMEELSYVQAGKHFTRDECNER